MNNIILPIIYMTVLQAILGLVVVAVFLFLGHAWANDRTIEQSIYYWKVILSGGEVRQIAIKPNTVSGNLEDFCFTKNAVNPTVEVAMQKCAAGSPQQYSIEHIRSLAYDAPIPPEFCSFERQQDPAWNKRYVGDCTAPPVYWRPAA